MASSTKSSKAIVVTDRPLDEYDFDWEIKKFSTYPEEAKLDSPIFGGGLSKIKWILRMTPLFKENNTQGILFKMKMIGSPPDNSFAKYELSIWDKGIIIKPKIHYSSCYKGETFVKCEKIEGLKTLFQNMDFVDDTLRLTCKVKLYNPEMVTTLLLSPIKEDYGNSFRDAWSKLFQSMENSDVSINVGGNILQAHKLILSTRSPVFATMFGVEMEESAENVVKIDDFELEDVKAFLEFIYTGQTEAIKKNPEIQIQLAEKYNLTDLKSACEVQLSQGITIENAIERLYLADRLNVPGLQSYIEKFIYRNKKELSKTEAFQGLASSELFFKLFANIFFKE